MRQTELSTVLFPVDIRPVHFHLDDNTYLPVRSHNVIINRNTYHPVGVVSANYRLVTNQEAFEFAKDCARQLFGKANSEDLEVFNVVSPGRGCYCRIDLINKGYEVNFLEKEVYLPFVRVTNSYNGKRALRFDVGYCRKICKNGVIFEAETIQFRFSHSHASIGKSLDFEIGKDKLADLQKLFTNDAERLQRYAIPTGMALPLFFKALSLPLPSNVSQDTATDKWNSKLHLMWYLAGRGATLVEKYYREMGQNAYALFNAVTDFASNPPEVSDFRRSTHSMQVMAGTWSHEFACEVSKKDGIDLDNYVGGYCDINKIFFDHPRNYL